MTDDSTIQKEEAELSLRVAFSGLDGLKSQLYQHASEDLRSEVGGVLVGDAIEEGMGHSVTVVGAIRAVGASAAHTHVTFTHESWNYIHGQIEVAFPGRKIVGWYHSHPGFGVFLSNYDEFICRSFFNLPWQVAVVVDPLKHEEGMFVWSGDRLHKLPFDEKAASPLTAPAPATQPDADAPSEIVIAAEDLLPEGTWTSQKGIAEGRRGILSKSVARKAGIGLGIILLLGAIAGFAYLGMAISHLAVDVRSLEANAAATTTMVIPTSSATEQAALELAGWRGRVEERLTTLDSAVAAADSAGQTGQKQKPPSPLITTYVVQPGDSLWRIVNAFYGDPSWVPQVAALNGLRDADRMMVGQKLWLPRISGDD